MSTAVKLMQRLPNRSIISKLSLSSRRYIAFSSHPSSRPTISTLRHHSPWRHRTHLLSTTTQDKDESEEQEDSVDENESEESDNEQSQQDSASDNKEKSG